MADELLGPDPQKILRRAMQAYSAQTRRERYDRLSFMDDAFFYPAQLRFLNASSGEARVLILAGPNQTGKTITVAAAVAFAATGLYPDWYRGKRFDKPPRIWCVGFSQALVRDSLQRHLLGSDLDDMGQGTIPLVSIAKAPILYPGGQKAVDKVMVTHHGPDGKPDGMSEISFKSYEQQRQRLQSESCDLIWCDERPPLEIFAELQMRTIATGGQVWVSYTPAGTAPDDIDFRFFETDSPNRLLIRISPEEAKHISQANREMVEADLPAHEVRARIYGEPQQGAGPVFSSEDITHAVQHFTLEDIAKDARHIIGVDLGHFAAAWVAYSPQLQKCWIHDTQHRDGDTTIKEEIGIIYDMTRGLKIVSVLPHDAGRRDPQSHKSMRDLYRDAGLYVLAKHATNEGGGINVKVGIKLMQEMLAQRRLVINRSCTELTRQLRLLHYDERGAIAKEKDHLVDAARYGILARMDGKELDQYQGLGFGGGLFSKQQPARQMPQYARNIDFNLFGDD